MIRRNVGPSYHHHHRHNQLLINIYKDVNQMCSSENLKRNTVQSHGLDDYTK